MMDGSLRLWYKKYDMRFLGRPGLDDLGLFWAVICDTSSAFPFYYHYLLSPHFVVGEHFCITWRTLVVLHTNYFLPTRPVYLYHTIPYHIGTLYTVYMIEMIR